MSNANSLWIVAGWICTAIFAEALPKCSADETLAVNRPKTFSSPREVFDVFRQAQEKRDWRTVFYCWTPRARKVCVFEALFACQMNPDDHNVLAVLKEYGVKDDAIEAEYFKLYKAKHGVDLAKLKSDREAKVRAMGVRIKQEREDSSDGGPIPVDNATVPPQLPEDLDLLREAVSTGIADNEGFYIAVNTLFANRDHDMTPIGPLEKVTVRGNTATGSASTTLFHLELPLNKKFGQKITTTYHFRRLANGWFLEFDAAN